MKLRTIRAVEIELGVPDNPTHLAGFYPPRYWSHQDDALKASLMIVTTESDQVIIFGSLDTLFLDSHFHNDLQSRLGDNYSFYLVASHTHNAPALARSVPKLGAINERWYQQVLDRIVDGISTQKSQKLVEIGQGSADTELVVNRRLYAVQLDYKGLKRGKIRLSRQVVMAPNEAGHTDKKLKTVLFRCASGRIRVVVWSLAAHPAFASSYQSISADFPGRVRSFIKQKYGKDVVSIFLPGLAGSSIPKCRPMSIFNRRLSQIMVTLAPFNKSIAPFDEAAYYLWSQKIGNKIVSIANSLDWVELDGSAFRHTQRPPQTIFKDYNFGGIDVAFKALIFGETVSFVLMNGEPLSEWTSVFNSSLTSEQRFIISGYSTGDCLYIPPKSEIRQGGYEINRFQSFFGLDGEFVSDIDNVMKTEINEVAQWLAQKECSL
ncbi:hypothetical protein HIMB100_00023420 [SAR116 cluster alpha proteobacterium HIMB100]|nr:hypothetical protein HIMB100_00023420 [SAR116 cluster alpha proteobacterium HIMB100]